MCRVIVCGGQSFGERGTVFFHLDRMHAANPIEMIITGADTEIDRDAQGWAEARRVTRAIFQVKWGLYGNGAMGRRNAEMIEKGRPTDLFVFPGERGTADLILRARRAGLNITHLCLTERKRPPLRLQDPRQWPEVKL